MSATVRIPTILRTYTGGAGEVTADGSTLSEVLDSLEGNHPGIRARILDDSGALRRFVNVYVGDDDVRLAHVVRCDEMVTWECGLELSSDVEIDPCKQDRRHVWSVTGMGSF